MFAVLIEGVVASFYQQQIEILITHSLCQDLKEVMNKYKKSTIWIVGDANLPDIDWHTDTISSSRYAKEIN